MAKLYTIRHSIDLNTTIDDAWNFFSNPQNLSVLTPPSLGFRIRSADEGAIYPGQILTYELHPIARIPMTWVTEITHVRKPNYFVDEQRAGPYKLWHHQHIIEEISNGVRVRDIVDYQMRFGIFGSAAHALIVSRQLREIFAYRTQALNRFFNTR